MTKTPEELTNDWKARKLEPGWYWIKNKARGIVPDNLIANDWMMSGFCNVIEVLAPCSYDHFIELTEKIKTLSSENERLLNLQAIKNKEIEELESDSLAKNEGEEIVAEQQAEINRLRKAINSALNFMACPDDLSGLTGKCNDQAAFDVLREALNNESEE